MGYPEEAKPLLLLRLALLLPVLAILSLIGLPSPYGAILAAPAVALLAFCLFVGWQRRQARARPPALVSLRHMLPASVWQALAVVALGVAVFAGVKRLAMVSAVAAVVFAIAGGVLIWG